MTARYRGTPRAAQANRRYSAAGAFRDRSGPCVRRACLATLHVGFESGPRSQQPSRVGSLKHTRAHHVSNAEASVDEPVTLGERRLQRDGRLGEALARWGIDHPFAELANPAK